MTFDDDFIRISGMNITLKSLELEWPPPLFIEVNNHGELPNLFLKRISCSEITDEQRTTMTHVVRGAEYRPCFAYEVPHREPKTTQ